MQTILVALRTLMLDLKLGLQDCKEITTAILAILNSARVKRLGSCRVGTLRSPLRVMSDMILNRAINRIIPLYNITQTVVTLDETDYKTILNIPALQTDLCQLQKDVSTKVSNRHNKAIATHETANNIIEPHFEARDYVLVQSAINRCHKQQYNRFEPLRVEEVFGSLVDSVAKLNEND